MGMDVVIGIGKGYCIGMDDISVVGADQWYKRRKERKRLRYSYRCFGACIRKIKEYFVWLNICYIITIETINL